MSIIRRLQLSYVAMVALVVLAGVAAAVTIQVVTSGDHAQMEKITRLLSNTAKLQVNVANETDAMRAELLLRSSGAKVSNDLSQYGPISRSFITEITKDAGGSQAIVDRLDEVKSRTSSFDTLAQATVEKARGGDLTGAVRDAAVKVEPAVGLLNGSLKRLQPAINEYREQTQASLRSTARTALWLVIIIVAVITAIGAAVTVTLPRGIERSLHGMVVKLQATVANLESASEQLAGGAVETATAVRQTAVTAEQLERASRLTSEKAGVVADGAKTDMESLSSALEASAATVAGITEIKGQMAVVGASVADLTEHLHSASAVIDASSDIAEQSNVLAVNAAIEAARAAEHSRGFRVVADEMHSLANQSKLAVVQVRQIIGETQKAAVGVVDAAESTSKAVDQGMLEVAASELAMESVIRGASDVVEGMTHISAAASQQLSGVEQIVESFSSIDVASSQIAGSARHVRERAAEIHDVAAELQAMIQRRRAVAEREVVPIEAPAGAQATS